MCTPSSVVRTVEFDLAPLSIGLATAYHRAKNLSLENARIGTATSECPALDKSHDDNEDAPSIIIA